MQVEVSAQGDKKDDYEEVAQRPQARGNFLGVGLRSQTNAGQQSANLTAQADFLEQSRAAQPPSDGKQKQKFLAVGYEFVKARQQPVGDPVNQKRDDATLYGQDN